MSDLEALIPQAVELVIDGEPLAIKPLKVGQMPAFVAATARCDAARDARLLSLVAIGTRGDLLTQRSDWWWVLDEKGCLVDPANEGFDSPEDAMAFAEQQMSQRFAAWGRDQALTHWEKFSLPGHEGYQELLLQLDDWPGNYQPRHYRTRNVLVHIRAGVRRTHDGQRIPCPRASRMVGRSNRGVCDDQSARSLDPGNADASVDTPVRHRDRRKWAMVDPAVCSPPT